MIQEIINLLNASGQNKVVFKPEVKVPSAGQPMWIDQIYKVRDAVMVMVSTNEDNVRMNIGAIDGSYLPPLINRLNALYDTM